MVLRMPESNPDEATPSKSRGAPIGPLRGVRILDLTRFPPGAYCTVVLADLGADVIRLEPAAAAGQKSLVVGQVGLARGKRSASLNFRHERGNEVLSRLAGSVDVLVENHPPGDLERRGFGYPQAEAAHPSLIWCSISGFGQQGPYASYAGHDLTYAAQSGVLTALSKDMPFHPGAMLAVPTGALFALTGILAALRERDLTGRGCQIDISLAEAATWMLGGLDAYFADDPIQIPVDASRRLYACQDGSWISVAAAEPRTWKILCDALGVPELIEKLGAQGDESEQVMAQLSGLFATKPAAEWVNELGPIGAAVGPVNSGGDIARDPHNVARATTTEVAGTRVVANPVRLSDGSGPRSSMAMASPGTVGEDTDDVLSEAGFNADEIQGLRADGVV
jgi:alpha-methylacyl-CoA racemase